MSRKKFEQAYDGEWIQPIRRGYKMMCCDCGLVHEINFRIKDGKIQIQPKRLPRSTANARRAFKFTPDND